MRILIFIVLVSIIGGIVLTIYAEIIKNYASSIIKLMNRSFEEEENEKDGHKW